MKNQETKLKFAKKSLPAAWCYRIFCRIGTYTKVYNVDQNSSGGRSELAVPVQTDFQNVNSLKN